MLSNREIATVVWLIPLCGWLLSNPPVRASCRQLLRSFFSRPVIIVVALMLLYTLGTVAALRAVGLWHVGFLKDTILWFCFSAFTMVLSFVTGPLDGNIFKSIAKDNVKAILLLEFIVNAYNFPLLGELAFVPAVTMIALLNAFAEVRDEHKPVATVTSWVLAITGLVLLYLAISDAINHYQQFGESDTLRAIVLPPLLSLLFAPFVFAAVVYAIYEKAFIRLRLGEHNSPEVVQYARHRLIRRFGLRIGKLNRFLSRNPTALMRIESREDVNMLLAEGP